MASTPIARFVWNQQLTHVGRDWYRVRQAFDRVAVLGPFQDLDYFGSLFCGSGAIDYTKGFGHSGTPIARGEDPDH
jgi:hypothetical protein